MSTCPPTPPQASPPTSNSHTHPHILQYRSRVLRSRGLTLAPPLCPSPVPCPCGTHLASSPSLPLPSPSPPVPHVCLSMYLCGPLTGCAVCTDLPEASVWCIRLARLTGVVALGLSPNGDTHTGRTCQFAQSRHCAHAGFMPLTQQDTPPCIHGYTQIRNWIQYFVPPALASSSSLPNRWSLSAPPNTHTSTATSQPPSPPLSFNLRTAPVFGSLNS